MYMSPEQARGENAALDERTDIYSLSVLFAELLSGKHYLADLRSVPEILATLRAEDFTWAYERVLTDSALAGAPHELVHVAVLGMLREPEHRWERVEDMIDSLERALAGDIVVCCPFTLAKRTSNRFTDWVEGHPMAVTLIVLAIPVLLLAGIAALVVRVVGS
jgi:serine/threonine protein kinase